CVGGLLFTDQSLLDRFHRQRGRDRISRVPCWHFACHSGSGDKQSASTDRKSTRLNSSHVSISYAVFCLKKKKKKKNNLQQKIKFHIDKHSSIEPSSEDNKYSINSLTNGPGDSVQ